MKKIYLLLTALIVGLSANAAVHTIFMEAGNLKNNYYVMNNGSGSGYISKEIGGDSNLRVYSTSTNLTSVKFTYETAASWSFPSNAYGVSSDFIAFWYPNDNTVGGTYQLKPVLEGSWTGNNSSWTNLEFTYVNGTTYKTATQTYPTSGSVNFCFKILEPNNGNAQKFYGGYGGTKFVGNTTSTNFSGSGNSSVGLTKGEKYHFEMDFSKMELKLVVEPDESLNPPVISIIEHTNPKINDTERGAKYFTATIAQATSNPGNNIYYTTDGTTPSNSSKLYTGEFQISGKSTIKAIAEKNGAVSTVTTENHSASEKFGWESTSSSGLQKKFRVNIEDNDIVGANKVLTIQLDDDSNIVTDDDGNVIDSRFEAGSPFAWAKYENFDDFDEMNHSSESDLARLTDHYDSGDAFDGKKTPGWIDLDKNGTDTHVARNFTPAYYRAYVYSDLAPVKKGENNPAIPSAYSNRV